MLLCISLRRPSYCTYPEKHLAATSLPPCTGTGQVQADTTQPTPLSRTLFFSPGARRRHVCYYQVARFVCPAPKTSPVCGWAAGFFSVVISSCIVLLSFALLHGYVDGLAFAGITPLFSIRRPFYFAQETNGTCHPSANSNSRPALDHPNDQIYEVHVPTAPATRTSFNRSGRHAEFARAAPEQTGRVGNC